MRGRKPKPTPLKILEGNPGKRPLNDREPQFRKGTPTPPAHLDAEAKAEWKRIVPHLAEVGMLALVDRAALAAYCANYSRWAQLEKDVHLEGESLVDAESGRSYTNPKLTALNKAQALMKAFMGDFGLTPSSRARIVAGGNADGPETVSGFARKRA